jgi:hypothetical protein
MKALVLTYDKYMVFADHMITRYMNLWPDNPFVFKIPYQHDEVKEHYEKKYNRKVEMIKSPQGIVETIETLLDGMLNEEWMFWCMDDRYPIALNVPVVKELFSYIKNNDHLNIDALMYINSPWGRLPENLFYKKYSIKINKKLKLQRRKGYRMIWIHQFMKVKVLRTLFANFPHNMKAAKEMDYILFQLKLPQNQRLYALDHNIALYGESTSRGLLTRNCYKDLLEMKFEKPDNFELGSKYIVLGDNTFMDNIVHLFKHYIKKVLCFKSKE